MSEEEEPAIEWLGIYLGPPDIVKSTWKKAYPSRKIILRKGYTITEYFWQFPTLKGALGAKLVSFPSINIDCNMYDQNLI